MSLNDDPWMKRIARTSGVKIQESDLYTALMTKNFLESPQCALELGFAILMDKPIILIVDKTTEIPGNLLRAAKRIERVDMDNPADKARAYESIRQMMEETP